MTLETVERILVPLATTLITLFALWGGNKILTRGTKEAAKISQDTATADRDLARDRLNLDALTESLEQTRTDLASARKERNEAMKELGKVERQLTEFRIKASAFQAESQKLTDLVGQVKALYDEAAADLEEQSKLNAMLVEEVGSMRRAYRQDTGKEPPEIRVELRSLIRD